LPYQTENKYFLKASFIFPTYFPTRAIRNAIFLRLACPGGSLAKISYRQLGQGSWFARVLQGNTSDDLVERVAHARARKPALAIRES
jgi:hypothetical protein